MALRLVFVAALLSVACNRGPTQLETASDTLLGCDRFGVAWYCDGLLGGRPVRAECSVSYGCLWSYETLQAGGVSVELSR